MSIRIESAEFSTATSSQVLTFALELEEGLNVLSAPNTWGKSTLMQGLVFGLGLEGSYSTSHLSPLGEAMTSAIEIDGVQTAVVESFIEITLRNSTGSYLRTRRYAASLQFNTHLVRTWVSDSRDGLGNASPVDMFVRQPGSATHELGFHRLLEEFIGWDLPVVPSFDEGQVKLYLEVLLPLFYIEQKYGWSGLAPRLPTQFRVRNSLRRGVEFVLGLHALDRMRRRDELRGDLAEANATLAAYRQRLLDLADTQGWRVDPDAIAALTLGVEAPILVPIADTEVTLGNAIEVWEAQLAEMESVEVELAGTRTDAAEAELAITEVELARESAAARLVSADLSAVQATIQDIARRSQEVEQDRGKLLDLRRLNSLGSDLDLPVLAHGSCPTCLRALDESLVSMGVVLDVDDNIGLLDAERVTLRDLQAASEQRVTQLTGAKRRIDSAIVALRSRARLLKDELAGPTNAPSLAAVQQRIELRTSLNRARAVSAEFALVVDDVVETAARVELLRERLRQIPTEDDPHDVGRIAEFRSQFGRLIDAFGLSSIPTDQVTIGTQSLLPEHDGFELTFDINQGMSASDTVRAKWAYYVALSEVASSNIDANPLGVLLIDEPRQQETHLSSVRELYRALGELGTTSQVIVASSAIESDLDGLLEGLNANVVQPRTAHLFVS